MQGTRAGVSYKWEVKGVASKKNELAKERMERLKGAKWTERIGVWIEQGQE